MKTHHQFPLISRLLHWAMALMILAMLFIGVGMVASISEYDRLVSIHKPLGIIILILAALRLLNRIFNTAPPPLPNHLPKWQRIAAHLSHWLLYVLMFALPLVGWAMLSAAAYPVKLYDTFYLSPIVGHSVLLYARLRQLHSVLAGLLFAVILLHIAAAAMHKLIYRDGVFESMAGRWSGKRGM
jgi:cytochrome b561